MGHIDGTRDVREDERLKNYSKHGRQRELIVCICSSTIENNSNLAQLSSLTTTVIQVERLL